MKIDQLRNLVEIIKCGSMNKAAEKLYITQPSLSRSIRALEDEIGKALLERTNRGVALTRDGEVFFAYAQSIISQVENLEQLRVMDGALLYSKLSVSVSSLFIKDEIILQYYDHVQSNHTDIELYETTAEEVIDNVAKLRSEIGLLTLNAQQLYVFRKMAELKDIEIEILDVGPLYVHLSENNDIPEGDKIHVDELLNYAFIHQPYDFFSNINLALNIQGIKLSDFEKQIEMNNYHSIIHMISRRKTFFLGNKWQVKELAGIRIRSLLIEDCDLERSLVFIKRKREILSNDACVFMDIVRESYCV